MLRRASLLLVAPLLVAAACAQEADDQVLRVDTDDERAAEVDTGGAAVSALRAAPDAVAAAGTARLEVVLHMAVMGESFEITATGSVDSAAEQMQMEMDMGALFEDLAASTGEELPAGLSGTMEMVADGSTFYLRSPMFSLMGVDGWISMTPDDLGTTAEGLGFGAGAYDFTQTLESLRGVGGEPEVAGQEQVRGVDTTHYRATLNLEQALAEAPAEQREQLEAAFEQLGGGEELREVDIPVDVWIDADGLPRRVRMDMGSMFAAAEMGEGEMTMTMEMFDYGEPVDIRVPSADEVTPLSETFGGLEDGAAP